MCATADAPFVHGLSDEDRHAVETFYAVFGGADPATLDGVMAPDWEDSPLAPDQAPGRAGVKPLIAGFRAAVPDAEVTLHQLIGAPGRAAARVQIAGTHTGELLGVAPTGRPFVLALHEFHRLEGGRLTHTWHLEDWFGWLNQIGAWPSQAHDTNPPKEPTS